MQRVFRIRFFSIFITLLILLQSVGQVFIFRYLFKQCKRAAIHQMAIAQTDEVISVLRFSIQDLGALTWIDKREFVYQGQLYDVVNQQKLPDSLIIQAIPDYQESRLLAIHRDYWQNAPPGQSHEGQLIQWFQKVSQVKYLSFSTYFPGNFLLAPGDIPDGPVLGFQESLVIPLVPPPQSLFQS